MTVFHKGAYKTCQSAIRLSIYFSSEIKLESVFEIDQFWAMSKVAYSREQQEPCWDTNLQLTIKSQRQSTHCATPLFTYWIWKWRTQGQEKLVEEREKLHPNYNLCSTNIYNFQVDMKVNIMYSPSSVVWRCSG